VKRARVWASGAHATRRRVAGLRLPASVNASQHKLVTCFVKHKVPHLTKRYCSMWLLYFGGRSYTWGGGVRTCGAAAGAYGTRTACCLEARLLPSLAALCTGVWKRAAAMDPASRTKSRNSRCGQQSVHVRMLSRR
jgi:hypothetical protein